MGSQAPPEGPDLRVGIADAALGDAPVVGHVGGEPVLLVRRGGEVFAVGATCTHYGAPLADGIVEDGQIRCPWHHACFDLATGEPRGPAIAKLPCWDVVLEGDVLRVGARREPAVPPARGPDRVAIVGGGAAGVACAEALRAGGHRGAITIVTGEGSDPVDRPNLSKDYLAGSAPEEWVYLRTAAALRDRGIALCDGPATEIDVLGDEVGSFAACTRPAVSASGSDAHPHRSRRNTWSSTTAPRCPPRSW